MNRLARAFRAGIFAHINQIRLRFRAHSMLPSDPVLTVLPLRRRLCGRFGAVCPAGLPAMEATRSPGPGVWQPRRYERLPHRRLAASPADSALDAAKGWLPVWLAHAAGLSVMVQAVVALFAVTGHMIPIFYRFKGGKGVATALGAGLALAPVTTLMMAAIWMLVIWRWRISALAS